jgi:hypothetical protein
VVDIKAARILRYDLSSSLVGEIRHPGAGTLEFNHPTALQGLSEGYLLREFQDHLIWLDERLQPVRSRYFRQIAVPASSASNPRPTGFLQAVATSDSLAGIGLLKIDGRPWAGFFSANLDPFELRQLGEQVDILKGPGELYLLLDSSVAALDGVAYALHYGTTTSIRQIHPHQRQLAAFPKDFRVAPSLPPNRGPVADPERFAALEGATFAVALFARGDRLFLLTRQPVGPDKTRWRFHVVDPGQDRILRSLALPTSANHLIVAPGARFWAILEKGPILRSGEQEIGELLLLPSRWIEDSSSQVLSDAQALPTCR